MKTIEEAAIEHMSKINLSQENKQYICDGDFGISFHEGVEFAQRWIPVEEELPEYTDLKNHNPINVKFTTILGEERVCTATFEKVRRHLFENSPYDDAWVVYPSGGMRLTTVTHWRPIEIK